MKNRMTTSILAAAVLFSLPGLTQADEIPEPDLTSRFMQYGEMHEAIGQKKSHGRVRLGELVKQPNVYAVGALENLTGEITINNGEIIVTRVGESGEVEPTAEPSTLQATMLAGASVKSWTSYPVAHDVDHQNFDDFVAKAASASEVDIEKPFVFLVEGEFTDVRLHVINGACPVHARMKKSDISAEDQPFEKTFAKINGTLIGVFAKDAVGKLTHPATMTHVHIIYKDDKTGVELTAHVEQVGLVARSTLKMPQ